MNYIFIPMPPIGAQLISIELMVEQDWPIVRAIYVEGINTGNATFEKSPPEWASWDAGHLRACRFVARSGGNVLGWAPSVRFQAGACTRASQKSVCTSLEEPEVRESERNYWLRSLRVRNVRASGPCRPEFSRKMFRVWNYI